VAELRTKRIRWGPEKDADLRRRYGFGFDRIVDAVNEGRTLDDREHPNAARYAHQRQLVVEMGEYAWVVPYVEDEDQVFLKTFFPSRKATAEYLA
jgi:hypothetical protein